MRRTGKFAEARKSSRGSEKFQGRPWGLLLFLWLTLVYSEWLVRAVTISAAFWRSGLVLSVLFAIPLALTVFLLAVQLRARWSRLLVLMFLIITYLLYASQLVYYKIFFQFYSATSMGNAGQVVQFWKVALSAIGKNLFLLLLLAVPLVLAAVYGRRIWSFPGKVSWKVSVFLGGLAVLFYFAVTWLLPFGAPTGSLPTGCFTM